MTPDLGLIGAAFSAFFLGYMLRVALKFFVRLTSGTPEDF